MSLYNNNGNWNSMWNYQFWNTYAATKNAYYLYYHAKESLQMNGIHEDTHPRNQNSQVVKMGDLWELIRYQCNGRLQGHGQSSSFPWTLWFTDFFSACQSQHCPNCNSFIMARKPISGRQESSVNFPQPQLQMSGGTVVRKGGQDEDKSYFLALYDTANCPECLAPFSRKNSIGQPVQEGCCKHVKCRRCLISNQSGCIQCHQANQEAGRTLRTTVRTRSTRSFPFPSTSLGGSPIVPALTNGFHHSAPPSIPTDSIQISYAPPSHSHASGMATTGIPSTISSTACLGLGLGAGLNGFHQSSPPPETTKGRSSAGTAGPPDKTKRRPKQSEGQSQRGLTLPAEDPPAPPKRASNGIQTRGKKILPALVEIQSRPSSQTPIPQGEQRETNSGRLMTRALPQARLTYGRTQGKFRPNEQFSVTITPNDYTRISEPELPLKKRLSPTKTSFTIIESVGTSVIPTSHGGTNSSSTHNSYPDLDVKPPTSPDLPLLEDDNLENGDSNSNPGDGRAKKKRSPVTIYDHISILSGDPLLYKCGVCLKKFKTKAHIKYHEFCQNGKKPLKCEECGQGFIAKSHFEYHMRTHTGERPYTCPKCGKGFNQRGKVTRHMRSHTGEKPFVCPTCGRGFANTQAMRSHILIHTGERPFACEYCEKRFTGMTNLKKHIITHTGERPFVCTHCGKSFGLKWTLDLHLRTHSSERPYACDQCSRAFSNSKDLRRHMVIHSGERPFKCWICGTAFRRKDNLDRHIKNTHNQPKEVAKQLANEAAAEYLASSQQADKSNDPTVLSSSSKETGPRPTTTTKSSYVTRSKSASTSDCLPPKELNKSQKKNNFSKSKPTRPSSRRAKRLPLLSIPEEIQPPSGESTEDTITTTTTVNPEDEERIPTLGLADSEDMQRGYSSLEDSLSDISDGDFETPSSSPVLEERLLTSDISDGDFETPSPPPSPPPRLAELRQISEEKDLRAQSPLPESLCTHSNGSHPLPPADNSLSEGAERDEAESFKKGDIETPPSPPPPPAAEMLEICKEEKDLKVLSPLPESLSPHYNDSHPPSPDSTMSEVAERGEAEGPMGSYIKTPSPPPPRLAEMLEISKVDKDLRDLSPSSESHSPRYSRSHPSSPADSSLYGVQERDEAEGPMEGGIESPSPPLSPPRLAEMLEISKVEKDLRDLSPSPESHSLRYNHSHPPSPADSSMSGVVEGPMEVGNFSSPIPLEEKVTKSPVALESPDSQQEEGPRIDTPVQNVKLELGLSEDKGLSARELETASTGSVSGQNEKATTSVLEKERPSLSELLNAKLTEVEKLSGRMGTTHSLPDHGIRERDMNLTETVEFSDTYDITDDEVSSILNIPKEDLFRFPIFDELSTSPAEAGLFCLEGSGLEADEDANDKKDSGLRISSTASPSTSSQHEETIVSVPMDHVVSEACHGPDGSDAAQMPPVEPLGTSAAENPLASPIPNVETPVQPDTEPGLFSLEGSGLEAEEDVNDKKNSGFRIPSTASPSPSSQHEETIVSVPMDHVVSEACHGPDGSVATQMPPVEPLGISAAENRSASPIPIVTPVQHDTEPGLFSLGGSGLESEEDVEDKKDPGLRISSTASPSPSSQYEETIVCVPMDVLSKICHGPDGSDAAQMPPVEPLGIPAAENPLASPIPNVETPVQPDTEPGLFSLEGSGLEADEDVNDKKNSGFRIPSTASPSPSSQHEETIVCVPMDVLSKICHGPDGSDAAQMPRVEPLGIPAAENPLASPIPNVETPVQPDTEPGLFSLEGSGLEAEEDVNDKKNSGFRIPSTASPSPSSQHEETIVCVPMDVLSKICHGPDGSDAAQMPRVEPLGISAAENPLASPIPNVETPVQPDTEPGLSSLDGSGLEADEDVNDKKDSGFRIPSTASPSPSSQHEETIVSVPMDHVVSEACHGPDGSDAAQMPPVEPLGISAAENRLASPIPIVTPVQHDTEPGLFSLEGSGLEADEDVNDKKDSGFRIPSTASPSPSSQHEETIVSVPMDHVVSEACHGPDGSVATQMPPVEPLGTSAAENPVASPVPNVETTVEPDAAPGLFCLEGSGLEAEEDVEDKKDPGLRISSTASPSPSSQHEETIVCVPMDVLSKICDGPDGSDAAQMPPVEPLCISAAENPLASSIPNAETPIPDADPGLGIDETGKDNRPKEKPAGSRKRTVHFIYSNPDEQQFSMPTANGLDDSNVRIVYLAAAAQAEDSDEETGTPRKVRLLYAEALGYGGNGEDPPQLIYTATTPNQHITSDDQSIYAIQPRFIDAPTDWHLTGERVRNMFAQQPPTSTTPLPMQVVTHSSGTSYAQSCADYPENLNIMERATDVPHLMPPEHMEERREMCAVFADHDLRNNRGMKLLASAALVLEEKCRAEQKARAQVEAAKAVAAVGEIARMKREKERLAYHKLRDQEKAEAAAMAAMLVPKEEPDYTENGTTIKEEPCGSDGHPMIKQEEEVTLPTFKIPAPVNREYHLGPRKHYLSKTRQNNGEKE